MDKQNKLGISIMESTTKPRICEVLGVDKPLRDWTLGEVQAECRTCKCSENCKLWDTKKMECRLMYSANDWDLADPPRFTEDEVTQAREIVRVFGREDAIRRTDDGVLCYGSIILNQTLFPSIRPGQSVEVGEIMGR